MYNIRSKGRFVSRRQYLISMLPVLYAELKTVRWHKCIWGSALAAIVIAIGFDSALQHGAFENTVHYAQAEEVATSTPVVEGPKEAQIEVRINWTVDRINQEIETQAVKYGVSAAFMRKIVQCESGYVTNIQSRHTLSYGREQSYGLVQIHLPAHKQVSYEEAINPLFALDFLAKNIAAGRASMWTCARK